MSRRIASSGDEATRRRRRLALYTVSGICVLVLWVVGVLAVAIGGSGASASQKPAGFQADGGAHTRKHPHTPAKGPHTPQGGTVRVGGGGESGAVKARHPNAYVQREHARQKRGLGISKLSPGGVKGEPKSYDPLGVKSRLNPIDKQLARAAAGKFVAAAYGYTGTDWKAYLNGLDPLVCHKRFFSSPGGKAVSRYAGKIEEGGVKSAAKLEHFTITSHTKTTVHGEASFITAESYNRYGDLKGTRKHYLQGLTLALYKAAYKVRTAGEPKEVRDK